MFQNPELILDRIVRGTSQWTKNVCLKLFRLVKESLLTVYGTSLRSTFTSNSNGPNTKSLQITINKEEIPQHQVKQTFPLGVLCSLLNIPPR